MRLIGRLPILLLAGLPALVFCQVSTSACRAHAHVGRPADDSAGPAPARQWHLSQTTGRLSAVARPDTSPAKTATAGSPTVWRRAREGWERSNEWSTDRYVPAGPPALHPIVVGLFELMLTVSLLIALSDRNNGHSSATSPTARVGDQHRP